MVTSKVYAGFLQNNRVHRDGEDRAARDAGVRALIVRFKSQYLSIGLRILSK